MDNVDFCPNPTPSPTNWCVQGWNFGSSANTSITPPISAGTFAGMFGRYPRSIRFADVTDGLSNTLMVGESIPSHCHWLSAFSPIFSFTSTNIPLNTMEEGDAAGSNYWRTCGFKSVHPGGVNFLMGDGSVTFIAETIDFQLFNQLGTRAGNEPVQVP
jgi:prepilin-type processing-associated H-X9-DG protein